MTLERSARRIAFTLDALLTYRLGTRFRFPAPIR